MRAQTLGQSDRIVVQVGTRPDAMSGGHTAMTITIQSLEGGLWCKLGNKLGLV